MEASAQRPFLARHEFLIRRLHSLSGLIPVGAYMCVHLLTNATVINGPASFQENVDKIHSLGKILPLVEWVFIFIPLLFHAIIGVLMISKVVPNTGSYPFVGNYRYTLQRATGMIAFAFIFYHVAHMHSWWGLNPFRSIGGAQFDPHRATSTAATAIQAAVWVQLIYAVGVLACVYHLANGLWTMGITWGVWITPAAQRRANWVAIVAGVGLAVVGLSALGGFKFADVDAAKQYEASQGGGHSQPAAEPAGAAAPDEASSAQLRAATEERQAAAVAESANTAETPGVEAAAADSPAAATPAVGEAPAETAADPSR